MKRTRTRRRLSTQREKVLNVEKATLTPAVFLTSGGMSNECKQFVNRLADLIARKREERYCDVVRHVRTIIRFAMLRTTLVALPWYRGKKMDSKQETLYQKSFTASFLPLRWSKLCLKKFCVWIFIISSSKILVTRTSNSHVSMRTA